MVDAPTIGRKGFSLDVAAFFKRYAALTALVALLAFNFAVTPHFASWQTRNVNLTQVATIVIVSVGMTLVIATGGIDLSVGSLMAISGALAPLIFLSSFGRSYPALGDALAFIVPIGVAGLFGLFNGWFITRFQVRPIAGTLVMFIAGRGIGQALTNGNLQVFKNSAFRFIGLGRIFGVPCQVVIMLALVAVAAWTLRSTLFGRQIVSVGGNERAARLMGLPVDRVKFLTYVRSGMFAGLAGVILAAQFGTGQPAKGVGWELFSIAAVVGGGTLLTGGVGSVATTLAGVLLLRPIFNELNFENGLGWISRSAYWQPVVRGVFLMGVVMASSGAARRAIRAAYPRTAVSCGARSTIRRADIPSSESGPAPLNPLGRWTVKIATSSTTIMGTEARGTQAPTRMSSPPTTSMMIVAQPRKNANGVPIACKMAMKSSGPRASLA